VLYFLADRIMVCAYCLSHLSNDVNEKSTSFGTGSGSGWGCGIQVTSGCWWKGRGVQEGAWLDGGDGEWCATDDQITTSVSISRSSWWRDWKQSTCTRVLC